jgi:hypothetical protein
MPHSSFTPTNTLENYHEMGQFIMFPHIIENNKLKLRNCLNEELITVLKRKRYVKKLNKT